MAKVFLRAYDRDIETLIDRGQLDEAIAHCHHILKTFPKHLETYRLLGKAYLEGKRYGDAVDIFSRVLASVPNDFVAQVGMSIIRDEENKLDDAIWHMERAFETQPSNSAIQSELQRLYGRRDGVQPPRIRMTRGALAHMYVQGELYPQAISEIKSVLNEDPGRSDMQALLARANFKSGAKNDAVDAALALLQRYPYSLDANRVLVELLSADRNENAQAYRQRVVELDPYAAQVSGSIFLSNEVSDAAVSLERLDWNGQPVGTQSDWREQQAIGLESGASRNEQPDWMKNPFAESTPAAPAQPDTGSIFDTPASSSLSPAQPADEIPDFMKAAGWGESTGAFDESKPLFADNELSGAAQPLVQGDLPDWVKAMKPTEPEPAAPAQEEELPDWINKIGTGALSASAAEQASQSFATPADDQSDWMKGFGETPQPEQASQDQPDWLKGFGAETESASEPSETDSLDWLKGPGTESGAMPQPAPSDTPDWLQGIGSEPAPNAPAESAGLDWLQAIGNEPEAAPQSAQTDAPDWLKGTEPAAAAETDDLDWLQAIGNEPEAAPPSAQTESPDWLTTGTAAAAAQTDDLDWLKGIDESGPEPAPAAQTDDLDWLKGIGESGSEPAPTPAAQPDDLSWLNEMDQQPESTPQPAQTETPDWLRGVASEPEPAQAAEPGEFDWLDQIANEPDITPQPAQTETPDWLKSSEPETQSAPAAHADDLDWLKGIGESEPAPTAQADDSDWLNQFGTQTESTSASSDSDFLNELTQEPVLQTPEAPAQPTASVEDLGKTTQEQDDSFAWLENLAAKQGASEGLLTKPEERLHEEPEWVKQAKGLSGTPVASQPSTPVEELGKSEQERDDSFAWLEGLAAKQGASEGLLTRPEERMEEEPEWVRQAKGLTGEPPVAQTPVKVEELGKSAQEQDDSFAWLENLAAKQGATEGLLTKPEERMEEEPEWVKQAKAAPAESPVAHAPANVEDLGRSAQQQDDSFAWLENLAANQGASEGLLTKPEEHLQEEPEWMKQAKSAPVEPPVAQVPANAEELGKSEQERDDSFAWLEGLAAKQGASEGLLTKPEERLEQEPQWVRQAKDLNTQQPAVADTPAEPVMEQTVPGDEALAAEPVMGLEQPTSVDETVAWLQSLDEEEKRAEPAADQTAMWFKSLDVAEPAPAQPATESVDTDMPAWMQNLDQAETLAAESAVPAQEPEQPSATPAPVEQPVGLAESGLPSWLSELESEEQIRVPSNADDLPAWLRDETGEVVAEPVKIEPTRPTDWKPAETKEPEIVYSPPLEEPKPPQIVYSPPLEETQPPEPEKPQPQVAFEAPEELPEPEVKPAPKAPSKATPAPEPYREPATRVRGTGMLAMPGVDQTLGSARSELSRSNIPGGLELYAKLIKKGRFLDEVIHDLREALYRFPVEVSIWQSLGDAYMRANRLQDALDAYTKAEELLR